jgi:hypothetical protein
MMSQSIAIDYQFFLPVHMSIKSSLLSSWSLGANWTVATARTMHAVMRFPGNRFRVSSTRAQDDVSSVSSMPMAVLQRPRFHPIQNCRRLLHSSRCIFHRGPFVTFTRSLLCSS